MTGEWDLAFVLPNLGLPLNPRGPVAEDAFREGISLGSRTTTIVSGEDERLVGVRTDSRAAERLLSVFRAENGKMLRPSVLLVRRDATSRVRESLEALVAFRNAVAVSIILRARAGTDGVVSTHLTWSDSFDFHPAIPGSRANIVVQTPARLSGITEGSTFFAYPSPQVPFSDGSWMVDEYLYTSLGRLWRERYEQGRRSRLATKIFRSLEVMLHSLAVGNRNGPSMHDYGLLIAHCVSALEILAHPGGKRKANEKAVRELVAKFHWSDPELAKRKYWIIWRDRTGRLTRRARVNLIEKVVHALYETRNRFLHGDRVDEYLLAPLGSGRSRPSLPRLATVAYRVALCSVLEPRFPRVRPQASPSAWLQDSIVDEWAYRALLRQAQ